MSLAGGTPQPKPQPAAPRPSGGTEEFDLFGEPVVPPPAPDEDLDPADFETDETDGP